MPDPAPNAESVERLWSALAESFSDYHARSSDQRKLLAQLVSAVEASELRRVLAALEREGVQISEEIAQRLRDRSEP